MTTSHNRILASLISLSSVAVLLTSNTVIAQVYKWRDNRGVVQYSDKPPVAGFTKANRNEVVNALQAKDLCAEPTAKTAALASANQKFNANFFGITSSSGFGIGGKPASIAGISTSPKSAPFVVATSPKPALAIVVAPKPTPVVTAPKPVTVASPTPVNTGTNLSLSPTNAALLQQYKNTGLINGMTVTAWAAASPANAALVQQYKNALSSGGVATVPTPKPAVVAVVPAPTIAPSTAAPQPASNPSVGANIIQVAYMPAVNINKNIVPVTGFNTLRIEPTSTQANQTGEGAFRISCGVSHMNNDDPMVYPNQQGAAHHHTFYGNTSINFKSDLNNLANTGNSTCAGGIMNRSAYWHPTMIDTATNAPVLPDNGTALFYYKTGYGVPTNSVKAPPKGLRMLVGNPKATNASQVEATKYTCINAALGHSNGMPWVANIPACKVGDYMQMTVQFPQCWDGKNLDSPNHKDHMAYPNGQLANQCPSSHPVAIPLITLNMNFTIKAANQTANWRLASDNYAKNGYNAGYSGHADWVNGWDEATMAGIVKNCLNASRDGQAHLLCDGRMFF